MRNKADLIVKFDPKELVRHSKELGAWHKFVRTTEFDNIANYIGRYFTKGLELGAGDGGQSEIIAKHCDFLTCTELGEGGRNSRIRKFQERNIPNVSYEFCDATNLSRYDDSSFDFVFSSNMLEHISNWKRCLEECNRVLKDDGIMVHTMPSREWKFWNSILFLIKGKKPQIHGVEKSNCKEFLSFGEKNWIDRIESSGLIVNAKLRLPFYFGFGPKPLFLIQLGNRLGWKSSTAYIIKKKVLK